MKRKMLTTFIVVLMSLGIVSQVMGAYIPRYNGYPGKEIQKWKMAYSTDGKYYTDGFSIYEKASDSIVSTYLTADKSDADIETAFKETADKSETALAEIKLNDWDIRYFGPTMAAFSMNGNQLYVVHSKFDYYKVYGSIRITKWESFLRVYDTTNKENPMFMKEISLEPETHFYQMAINENYLFITDRLSISVFDIKDSFNPKLVTNVPIENNIILSNKQNLFVFNKSSFDIFDVSDPTEWKEIANIEVAAKDATTNNDHLYVLTAGKLKTYSMKSFTEMSEVSAPMAKYLNIENGIVTTFYDFSYYLESRNDVLNLYDFSNPAEPIFQEIMRDTYYDSHVGYEKYVKYENFIPTVLRFKKDFLGIEATELTGDELCKLANKIVLYSPNGNDYIDAIFCNPLAYIPIKWETASGAPMGNDFDGWNYPFLFDLETITSYNEARFPELREYEKGSHEWLTVLLINVFPELNFSADEAIKLLESCSDNEKKFFNDYLVQMSNFLKSSEKEYIMRWYNIFLGRNPTILEYLTKEYARKDLLKIISSSEFLENKKDVFPTMPNRIDYSNDIGYEFDLREWAVRILSLGLFHEEPNRALIEITTQYLKNGGSWDYVLEFFIAYEKK